MKTQHVLLVTSMTAFLGACSTIQHYEKAEQPTTTPLTAGVGDVVLRVNRQHDLPNIAGKADLFGRKTDEGFSEIRYMGVQADGAIAFARQDVTIRSNETTMTRTGAIPLPTSHTTYARGQIGGYRYSGVATSTGSTWVPTAGATTTVLPSGVIPIRLEAGQPQTILVGKYEIHVKKATPSSITYFITK